MAKQRKERSDKGAKRKKYKAGGGGKRVGAGNKLLKISKEIGSKKAAELLEKAILEEKEKNSKNN